MTRGRPRKKEQISQNGSAVDQNTLRRGRRRRVFPTHMVVVARGHAVDVFSSHANEIEAHSMKERLQLLVTASGCSVHVLPVPQAEGLVNTPLTEQSVAQPVPVPAKPKITPPVRAKTNEEFLAETIAMEESGGFRDADAPLSEGGAYA